MVCMGLAGAVCAREAAPAPAGGAQSPQVVQTEKGGLEWDGGADLRVRQELHDNVPQYNANGAVSGDQSYLRIRPRVWGTSRTRISVSTCASPTSSGSTFSQAKAATLLPMRSLWITFTSTSTISSTTGLI